MTIKNLKCRIRVKKAAPRSPRMDSASPERESQRFSMPLVMVDSGAVETSAETATEDRGPSSGKRGISPKGVDPNLVANRVYDLMKQEISLDKTRRGRW